MDGRGCWYRFDKRATADGGQRLPVDFVRRLCGGFDNACRTSVLWHRGKQKVGEIGLVVAPGRGVLLHYTYRGEDRRVWLDFAYSDTPFGGRRAWWACPGCGRRCGVAYAPLFVCRKCAGVDYYQIQQSGDALTVIDNRLNRIRRKLGATDGATGERLPTRPRYMHHRTYARLAAEYLELQEQSEEIWLGQLIQRFGMETPS